MLDDHRGHADGHPQSNGPRPRQAADPRRRPEPAAADRSRPPVRRPSAHLDQRAESPDSDTAARSGALARLTVKVRSSQGGGSDTLRLASWYTNDVQPVDADRVLNELTAP